MPKIFLDKLRTSLGAADSFRNTLTDECYDDDLKNQGKEVADRIKAIKIDCMRRADNMARTDEIALRRVFKINGDLIARDDKGNRTLGKFTLTGGGAGFAVEIDSEKGASISENGGAFTKEFARITPVQLLNLPYLKAISDAVNIKI